MFVHDIYQQIRLDDKSWIALMGVNTHASSKKQALASSIDCIGNSLLLLLIPC